MEFMLRLLDKMGMLRPEGQARLEVMTLRRIARDMDASIARMDAMRSKGLYIDMGIRTRMANAVVHIKTAGGSLIMNITEARNEK